MDLRYREHVLTVNGHFDARKEGRFRGLFVRQDEMLEILIRVASRDKAGMPAYFIPCGLPDLPPDVAVDSVHFDAMRRGFIVTLVSAQFEPVPHGQEIPILQEHREYRRATTSDPSAGIVRIDTAAGMVSVPEVIKHWEGEHAADAPSAQELPAGAVTQATRHIPTYHDAAYGDTVLSALPDKPAKSEARLALEYDLRQLLPVAPGGILDKAIQNGPDLLLTDALRRAKAGKPGDAVRYLKRAE